MEFVGTEHERRLWNKLTAVTLDGCADNLEHKRTLLTEVRARRMMPVDVLTEYPTLYVGSHIDVRYPLLLGARKVIMLDPLFRDVSSIMTVIDIIEEAISRRVETSLRSMSTLRFSFDFGQGEESAEVTCVGQKLAFDDIDEELAEEGFLDHRRLNAHWQSRSERGYTPLSDVDAYIPSGPLGMLLAFNPMGAHLGYCSDVMRALVPGGIVFSNHQLEGLFLPAWKDNAILDLVREEKDEEEWRWRSRRAYEEDGRFDFFGLVAPGVCPYSLLRKR